MLIELAHIRNMLFENIFNTEEQTILLAAKELVVQKNGPFVSLMNSAIDNCFIDIEKGNYISAAREIDLIHNLPLDYAELSQWNESYFYCGELGGYFENNDNFIRIKHCIHELSKAENKIEQNEKRN